MKQAPVWEVNKQEKEVLHNLNWLGRYQILNVTPNLTYFLDGAHTIESIKLCSQWYANCYSKSQM